MPKYPGFVGPSYTSQSKIAAAERCVNWYPERIEAPVGKVQWALYPAPGFELVATLPEGPVRGLFHLNGRTFAVGGSRLYELGAGYAVTELGTGLNNIDGLPVTIHSNGDGGYQLFIASASKGYVYDLRTSTLTLAVEPASVGGYIDGFFLALDPARSELKISNLMDGATWEAGQVSQRNAAPDKWAAMIVSHKEIWLFGTQTTEVWYNAGATPFPFVPNPSVFIEHGIYAPHSAALLDNAPMWLGRSPAGGVVVYRANGYTPQRVSTHALEYAFSTYSTLTDAEAWTYSDQGHSFYVLSFPTAGATWVYDAATGAWHERGSWDGYEFTGLPVRFSVFTGAAHLVGSRTTGAIYRMGIDLTTEVGAATIRRVRRAPHLSADGARLLFDRLEVALEVGLGLSSGQGSAPVIMLRWSDDGGQTWGNWHDAGAGAQGEYRTRAIWRRLGQSRDRVFEIAVSDPIPWRILEAYVDVRGGRS